MNAEVNSILSPWSPLSPSLSVVENENEYGLSRESKQQHIIFLHGIRRQVPSPVFFNVNIFNVNIFNFSPESFSSNFIFAPLLPILLSFLQIQSSGMSPSPFELRPMAFVVSVGCSVAYFLTLPAKFMFPGFASQFGFLMSVFGSLAVSTLICLTLKLPCWSILFILLFMGGFLNLLNELHATYGNISRPQPRTMQPVLPLYNVMFNH